MWIGEAFRLATLAVVVLAFLARKTEPDALGLAAMLLLSWSATNLADALWEAPASRGFNTVIDLTIGLMTVAAYATKPKVWKLALAFLFGVQMIAHVIYQGWAAQILAVRLTTYEYVWVLNTTFAIQLVVVAWPGLRDVVLALSAVRRVPMGRHLEGGSAWP